MEDQITIINDLYYPKKGYESGLKMSDTWYEAPTEIASHAENNQVCVQAGGNVGHYTSVYSKLFDLVYTFEPDPINFYCLTKNASSENVYKFQACLGDSHQSVQIGLPEKRKTRPLNIGTYFIKGDGHIPVLTIDDLSLNHCDLIHLDIEGFEYNAILGASETIDKFHPVICLEINRSSVSNFKIPREEIFSLMESLNYYVDCTINEDYIFKFKEDEEDEV